MGLLNKFEDIEIHNNSLSYLTLVESEYLKDQFSKFLDIVNDLQTQLKELYALHEASETSKLSKLKNGSNYSGTNIDCYSYKLYRVESPTTYGAPQFNNKYIPKFTYLYSICYIENKIHVFKTTMCNLVKDYLNGRYNLDYKLDYRELYDTYEFKHKVPFTLENILNVYIKQLQSTTLKNDGISKVRKYIQENNRGQVKITGSKLTFSNFGYNDMSIRLYHIFSLFEDGTPTISGKFESENKINDKIVFDNTNKLEYVKSFMNGRLDIKFRSREYLKEFIGYFGVSIN